MDLEQEFQKLMDEAVQKVQSKQNKGEYSHREADDLIDMIAKRRYQASARALLSAFSEVFGCSRLLDRDLDRVRLHRPSNTAAARPRRSRWIGAWTAGSGASPFGVERIQIVTTAFTRYLPGGSWSTSI